MIHSAKPTVSPVVNIVFAWKLFCFARFWKVGTDGRTYERTTCAKTMITSGRDSGSAEWIKRLGIAQKSTSTYSREKYNRFWLDPQGHIHSHDWQWSLFYLSFSIKESKQIFTYLWTGRMDHQRLIFVYPICYDLFAAVSCFF